MLNKNLKFTIVFFLLGLFSTPTYSQNKLYYVGETSNDLYNLMKINYIDFELIPQLDLQQINKLPKKSSLIVVADSYPEKKTFISEKIYQLINKKSIRLYIEYPEVFPSKNYAPKETYRGTLERGIITSNFFMPGLNPMSIVSLNDCSIIPVESKNSLIVLAKVAGFDKAEYGLKDTKTYPALIKDNNMLISATSLSNYYTGRYGPSDSWRIIWEKIFQLLTKNEDLVLKKWEQDPAPSYTETESLSKQARLNAIRKGTNWFYESHLLIHPTWKDQWLKYQEVGKSTVGPSINKNYILGDGSMGILEGHTSSINFDGTQKYRYWIRTDVQGEAAFALAASGRLLKNNSYLETSEKLTDFLFYNSKARDLTNDTTKGAYGLLGWAYTHQHVIYGDDNARATLGVIGASSYLQNQRWNKLIVENILANFRISSKNGFQGSWTDANNISKRGWMYFSNRDLINPHPHYESWMWACYLWLYNKTGYRPLLDKAKNAIKITMNAYPDKWNWTNGIQQERARMVLPLAWLVRIEDTPEHRQWLIKITDELLKSQVECGAIREELGNDSTGRYGREKSNADYGTKEAPLIFRNGDKVADMLYTNNFAFFALNEAAQATKIKRYQDAVNKLAEFLIKIQVKSENHSDLDGAWFRAFDYGRWDYWGSNADIGWGTWGTLSGWIQSWIVATQVLVEEDQSFWDVTKQLDVKEEFNESLWMLN